MPTAPSASSAIELMPGVPWATPEELNRLLRQQGLCLAVAQAAVFDDIAQQIPLEPEQEQQWIQRWLERQGIESDTERDAMLRRKGWTLEDLRYFATKGLRLERFKQQVFDGDVELRFLERKLDLDEVTYSLIRVEDEALAWELYHRIADDGDDFALLAAEHSQGSERHNGGRIGPAPLSQSHEAVAQQLRVSRPGQLWPPFFLVNIWLILRLDEHVAAQLDDGMRQMLREELFEEWLERRVEQLLAGETPLPLSSLLLTSAAAPPEATPG